MKKLLLQIIFILSAGLCHAQRFFYVENKDNTEGILKNGLLKASQFVTESPVASDYIIKTDIGLQKGSHILTLNMILEDSVTFSTIYQTKEEYTFSKINDKTKIFLKLAITTFIDKNISQIILCAKEDHLNSRMNYLKPGKDKT